MILVLGVEGAADSSPDTVVYRMPGSATTINTWPEKKTRIASYGVNKAPVPAAMQPGKNMRQEVRGKKAVARITRETESCRSPHSKKTAEKIIIHQ